MSQPNVELGVAYSIRAKRSTPVDDAFRAWTSGDLGAMLAATTTKTNLVDRHFLLQGIVGETYKRRNDARMRELCETYAQLHVKEFTKIAATLKTQCDGVLPHVTTFQQYATLLNEARRYDEAIEVCRTAISYGLHDGTKSGFEGRITRILKGRDDAP